MEPAVPASSSAVVQAPSAAPTEQQEAQHVSPPMPIVREQLLPALPGNSNGHYAAFAPVMAPSPPYHAAQIVPSAAPAVWPGNSASMQFDATVQGGVNGAAAHQVLAAPRLPNPLLQHQQQAAQPSSVSGIYAELQRTFAPYPSRAVSVPQSGPEIVDLTSTTDEQHGRNTRGGTATSGLPTTTGLTRSSNIAANVVAPSASSSTGGGTAAISGAGVTGNDLKASSHYRAGGKKRKAAKGEAEKDDEPAVRKVLRDIILIGGVHERANIALVRHDKRKMPFTLVIVHTSISNQVYML